MYWKKRKKVNYPDKRKKKRVHTQFMSYSRVIEVWGIVPCLLNVFEVDGEFGLYEQTPGLTGADIIVDDKPYRRKWVDDRCSLGSGNAVFSYVAVIEQSCKGIHKGRVVYMEHPVQRAARDIGYLLNINPTYLKAHIVYKIW